MYIVYNSSAAAHQSQPAEALLFFFAGDTLAPKPRVFLFDIILYIIIMLVAAAHVVSELNVSPGFS